MRTMAGQQDTLTRRGFLSARPGLSSLVRAALAPRLAEGDTLVVVTLWGGLDGLTAFPPVGDPHYAAARPSIAVPREKAVPLDRLFSMHPALAPLKEFWDARKLAVVQAVDIPYPTRSHFQAQADLGQAAPGSSLRSGWLNRVLGTWPGSDALRAVQVGDSVLTSSLVGPEMVTTLWKPDDFRLDGEEWTGPILPQTISELYRGVSSPAATAARATLAACARLAPLSGASYKPRLGVHYPPGELGSALEGVASLLKAGLKVRIAAVDYGDWDFHADLGAAGDGAMAAMLAELGGSLAAFATDLGPLLDKVTIVTLSEFGRRVVENGSGGTDHGHGNVMVALGGKIKGGRVYGNWPGLSPSDRDGGDLRATTDYRSVLGELLVRRCAVASLGPVFPRFRANFLGLA
ncbi:MAG: DUF1501 domain-containing protein [Acidimicrobiales bacterium]